MDIQIDYSNIPAPAEAVDEDWDAPRHVFFGKKLEGGKSEKEPIYSFKPFPSMRYSLNEEGKIIARLVNNEAQDKALGEGWVHTPAEFGYIGAPSFEQSLELKAEPEVADKPARGRKPKAAEELKAA